MHEEERDLIELLHILLKRKWIIVLSGIVAAAIAFGFTNYAITPAYRSQTTLMVNSSKGSGLGDIAAGFDLGSLNLSQKLVVTYSEIVKSRIVLEQVIERLELPVTYDQLLETISAEPVGTTEILRITVESDSPEQAADIANNTSEVFIKEVVRILKVDNVEIIDEAIPIPKPINVKLILNVAVGGIVGMMLSVGGVFLAEFLDSTLKTADDIEKYLELPVIGTIVDFEIETDLKEADYGRANRSTES